MLDLQFIVHAGTGECTTKSRVLMVMEVRQVTDCPPQMAPSEPPTLLERPVKKVNGRLKVEQCFAEENGGRCVDLCNYK